MYIYIYISDKHEAALPRQATTVVWTPPEHLRRERPFDLSLAGRGKTAQISPSPTGGSGRNGHFVTFKGNCWLDPPFRILLWGAVRIGSSRNCPYALETSGLRITRSSRKFPCLLETSGTRELPELFSPRISLRSRDSRDEETARTTFSHNFIYSQEDYEGALF